NVSLIETTWSAGRSQENIPCPVRIGASAVGQPCITKGWLGCGRKRQERPREPVSETAITFRDGSHALDDYLLLRVPSTGQGSRGTENWPSSLPAAQFACQFM